VRRSVELPIVLSLGSNLGNRQETILHAIAEIGATAGITVTAASALIETPALKPHGIDTDAPAYLNAIVIGRSSLAPERLLERLNEIEKEHGRVREERWGDRTLDIDIVAMGALIVTTDLLTIPHPRAHERAFVLAPWLEIDPDAVLVGRGRVDELLAATGESVTRFGGGS
jgi:2-amino-4-hydroxy-6-hydroxymethyldihydropteridine diphosphokinase